MANNNKKRSAIAWLMLEGAAVVVFKIATEIGHVLACILGGRLP